MHTRSVQLPYFDSGAGGMAGYAHLTGAIDEWMVHQAARLRLGGGDYHLIRGVILPTGNGTTRLDRIIVSPYGVFVIDTMNMRGKIFGGREQRGWFRQTPKGKQAFANPLYQLYRRARLLVSMLGIDARKVFPMVVFVGGSSFKTPMPENVTRAGGYVRYIKSKSMPILTKADVARIVHKIEASQFDPLAEPRMQARPARPTAAKAAVKTCPDCGSDMKLKIAKKGAQAGKSFWVCSTFPKCMTAIEHRSAVKPSADSEFSRVKLM